MYLHERSFADAFAGAPAATARQVYAGQSRVRELTDRNFQTIFYDRNKVIVLAFWADTCRPCDAVASTVVSVAARFAQGPLAKLVKFYHAQWDPRVNPRLHRQYGLRGIPVVYFYYTSSGRQPDRAAPLLEAAAGGDRFAADPAKYIRDIEQILARHGHTAASSTIAENRGWSHSRQLIGVSDFADVDRMMIAPSPFQKYFADLYRAQQARFSRAASVVARSTFDVHFQRINGSAPGADDMGTLDRINRISYLAVVMRDVVYLNSAVHEAVHFYACPMQGRFSSFGLNYGLGFSEGFTQLVTEEILKAQHVKIANPPYRSERALAAKLVEVVGLENVADDYFLCTRHVHTALERVRVFGSMVPLWKEAEKTKSDALKEQRYDEIKQLLESVRGKLR